MERAAVDLPTALCRLREQQGLTLPVVAALAGLSKAYMARLAYGERVPECDTLIALLLASFSRPVRHANRVLLLAGSAAMYHEAIAKAV